MIIDNAHYAQSLRGDVIINHTGTWCRGREGLPPVVNESPTIAYNVWNKSLGKVDNTGSI